MIFYHAHLSTSHFDFDGYGEDPERAAAVLISALRLHGKQHELAKSWYFPLLPDATVTELRMNRPYRDGSRMGVDSAQGVGTILRSGRVDWQ
jgi:hypothetical protein